jgi:hypothetical protein
MLFSILPFIRRESGLYGLHPVVHIAVNTTNKTGISSMKTTDVGIYLIYLM